MSAQDEEIEDIKYLGRYEVIEPIGKGSTATVYRAADRRLKRIVALKMLKSAPSKDSELVQRFIREAEVMANLNHPNIISVHDIDEYKGNLFFTMELIDGQNLTSLVVSQGTLACDLALTYLKVIAKVLQAFYTNGIVHRDLTPSNIMITRQGVLKVMDFGLVKLADSTLSKDGVLMGTFEYCPPEQLLEGREVDIRTDIYAAGGSLYFMLTGIHCFEGTVREVIGKQLSEPLPRIENIPDQVNELIAKMTAKVPEDRFQTPFEMSKEIEACLERCC